MATASLSADPVALVVEDRPESRETRISLLKAHGFAVFSADNATHAIQEIHSVPALDIVVTDINLDPKSPSDKSGVKLAQSIRAENPTLPIVGYSAAFEESDLAPVDLAPFDDYLPKGSFKPVQLTTRMLDWRERAIKYRDERRAAAAAELSRLRIKYNSPQPDFTTLLLLRPGVDEGTATSEELSAEEVLSSAGYCLRIVEPGTSRPVLSNTEGKVISPLIIWVKAKDGTTIAEVYGYPSLYGFGDTEDEALRQVLLLMDGFWKELVVERPPEATLSGTTRRLRDFLKHVFG